MPAIGLAEAARLTGRNRSTIHRAMHTGRLSYTKTADGERRVEVAELERVFAIVNPSDVARGSNGATPGNGAQPVQSHSAQPGESERVIAAQRETIERQDATIADLRRRLDSLLALLTGPRRPWWRRWWR